MRERAVYVCGCVCICGSLKIDFRSLKMFLDPCSVLDP